MSQDKMAMTDSTFGDKTQWSLLSNAAKANVATEDHLLSLGLDIDDGLPKFKLNEPGPVALASSIFQKNNMITDEGNDSEKSFVVLGKTSFESIREASMASYMEIQEKSTLTDHNSLISMMSPIEIEEHLKKVLEENLKLKETLKQNNTAIKLQFNTITQWQKEVMTVCDNHKQKFEETKELISRLKKENDELREKIGKNQFLEMSQSSGQETLTYSCNGFPSTNSSLYEKVVSADECNISSVDPTKSNEAPTKAAEYSITDLRDLANFNNFVTESKKLQSEQDQLKNEQDLLKKVDKLTEELSNVKINYSSTQEVLQELEKRYHTDIEMFSQQLQKANKELDSFKQKANSTNSLELQKLVNNCCEKDMKLKYLEEIITSLELQIKKFEENGFPLVDLEIEPTHETSDDRQLLKEKIEFYNAKLADLSKCFASQCSRYLRIQECLKESACIIQVFESARLLPNDMITEEKIKNYKEKLCEFRKTLITEQLHSIDDKQATIKTQQQFQKILSDYNSVICELEIIKDENSKLQTLLAKAEEENFQKWAEIEKQLNEEKRILEKEKTELMETSLKIQIDKKQIVEEKKQIDTERNYLSLEKDKLQDERSNLCEERTSLDRQSKLYEAEEGTLQKEKKLLQKKCEYFSYEIDKLKQELHEAKFTIQNLHADNNKLKENEELVAVYKIQTEVREKEFVDMRALHKHLQDQVQNLAFANLQLRSENDRLGGSERQANNSSDRQYVNLLVCPKCTNGFDAGSITAHMQQCMNSH